MSYDLLGEFNFSSNIAEKNTKSVITILFLLSFLRTFFVSFARLISSLGFLLKGVIQFKPDNFSSIIAALIDELKSTWLNS